MCIHPVRIRHRISFIGRIPKITKAVTKSTEPGGVSIGLFSTKVTNVLSATSTLAPW